MISRDRFSAADSCHSEPQREPALSEVEGNPLTSSATPIGDSSVALLPRNDIAVA